MKYTFRFLVFLVFWSCLISSAGSQVFEDITAVQSDSLINANYDNPNFVILDVRTSGEYNPQHLEDAINIDYYAADFSEQLDQLNKEKTYLIHCKSGGRSGVTFDLMQTLGFQEVYNMVGGMNAWNAASLPTTDAFAPRFMFVSQNDFPLDTVALMTSDTLELTITNRGNSMLTFEAVSSLAGTEFGSDFDLETVLLGAEDYTFQIIYTPEDELVDSLTYVLESNAGIYQATFVRIGQDMTVDVSYDSLPKSIAVFPNPVSEKLFFKAEGLQRLHVEIFDNNGRLVLEQPTKESLTSLDVSNLKAGVYFVRISDGRKMNTVKIIVEK